MYPRLLTEPFTLHTYGVLLALAFLAALGLASRQSRREGLPGERIADMAVFVIVGGLLGAKLLLVLVEWPNYGAQLKDALATFPAQGVGAGLRRLGQEALGLLQSGGVFYGGLLGALPVAAWFIRRYGLPFWQTGDALAPAVVLGQAIGRLGCFSAGCCYGRETGVPWAVTFRDAYAMRQVGTRVDVPLHPTQIYESLACFLILAVLLWLSGRKRFHGQVLAAYLMLYAVARFTIEIYRGDPRGSVFEGALSTSQFIAVLLFLGAALVTPWLMKNRRVSAPASAPEPAADGAA